MKPEHRKNAAMPPALVSFIHRMGVPLVLFLLCVLGDAACSPGAPPDGEATDQEVSALPASALRPPPIGDLLCPSPNDSSNLPSDNPPPQPTAPVGTIPGSFEVGQSGQATYSMSLDLPPGRHGMQPSLGIRYDSANGDGILGVGFSVTGLSAVTRCPKTLARDSIIQDVRYQGDDAFCLDGQRLVVVSDGADQTEYRTFPDTFAKIIAFHPQGSKSPTYDPAKGPLFWRESTKSGLTLQFGAEVAEEPTGSTSGAAFALNGAIRAWWLTTVADRRGNSVEYAYQKDASAMPGMAGYTMEIAPSLIRYTRSTAAPGVPRNSVRFNYDTKDQADSRTLFSGGMAQRSARRLSSIQMLTAGDVLVHEYDFTYELGTNSQRTLLAQVEECTGGPARACKPPTRFTWKTQPAAGFTTAPISARKPIGATMLGILDLNGDGLQDLVSADSTPSQFIADTGDTIQYHNAIQVSMNPGAALPAQTVAMSWDIPYVVDPDRPTPLGESATPIDYNQDGKADLLLHDTNHRFPTFQILLTTPNGATNNTPTFRQVDTGIPNGFSTEDGHGNSTEHGVATHLADMTGDGVPDLILCNKTFVDDFLPKSSFWEIHPWTPTGFQLDGDRILPLDEYPCDAPFYIADVNADNKVDLLISTGFSAAGSLSDPSRPVVPGSVYAAVGATLPFGTALGWEISSTEIPVRKQDRLLFLDANGDGLMDAIQSGVDDSQIHVYFNVGDTFVHGHGFTRDYMALSPLPDGIPTGEFLDLAAPIDFNADGRQDLLVPMRTSPGGATNWFILQANGLVTGDGSFTAIQLPFVHASASMDTDDPSAIFPDSNGGRVADFDGDGAADVLLSLSDVGPVTLFNAFALRPLTMLMGKASPDVIVAITDGAKPPRKDGGFVAPTVTIGYGPLLDSNITHGTAPSAEQLYHNQPRQDNPCAYPRSCVVGTEQVVSFYGLDDGLGGERSFSVFYRDGRSDRLVGGWLGFEKRITVDSTRGTTFGVGAGTMDTFDNVTFNDSLQAYPFIGVARNHWSWSPPPASTAGFLEIGYSDATLEVFPTNRDDSGAGRTFFAQATQRVDKRVQRSPGDGSLAGHLASVAAGDVNNLVPAIRTTTHDYPRDHIDDFGNVREESISTAGVSLTDRISRDFLPADTDQWLVGQLGRQTETSGTTDADTQTRTLLRTYLSTGEVETETREGDDGRRGTTEQTFLHAQYTYDKFGNVIATSVDDGDAGDIRKSCTSYDAEGYFPHATANGVGQRTFMKYDPGLGVQTASEDVNGLVTRSFYDGFGRRIEELRPDGTSTISAMHSTATAALSVTTGTTGGMVETTDYDTLGRPFRTFSSAPCPTGNCPAGAPRLLQQVKYDSLGNVISVSQPRTETAIPDKVPADQYTYDTIGRVIAHVTPSGFRTDYTYAGNTVTSKNALGELTVITQDALQRPTNVKDAKEGHTEYTYGPFGQLLTVQDPIKATTTFVRDPFGRLVELDDPDRGTTFLIYDGFGELRNSLDQAGRSFSFTYDAIGRKTQRTDPDGTTRWNWDPANGQGKIGSIVNPKGATQTWGYDTLSRVNRMELSGVDGEDLTASMDYDEVTGLPKTFTYPETGRIAPFSVRNEYDAHGYLIHVTEPGRTTPFWSMDGVDNAGRITGEVFGNGVRTDRAYFPTRDRLASILTRKGDQLHQDLLYDYDEKQNLFHRSDLHDDTNHVSEVFGYDALDRVTCSRTQSGIASRTDTCGTNEFIYNASGNLLSKDGRIYTYPHASHAVASVGADIYQYDAVGNQTVRPNGRVKYTAFDLPKEYDGPHGEVITAFDYGGTEERIRKETDKDVTLYLGGFYERVEDKTSSSIVERFYIRSAERVVAIHERRNAFRAPGSPPTDTAYLHTDNLGSVDVITNDNGAVIERRSYDAFGARRQPRWNDHTPFALSANMKDPTSARTTLGYTSQESDDEFGLVNMKGRVYDPKLGRFLTPDPIVSNPLSGQSWNRYSYALNNPLRYVDPSGFSAESGALPDLTPIPSGEDDAALMSIGRTAATAPSSASAGFSPASGAAPEEDIYGDPDPVTHVDSSPLPVTPPSDFLPNGAAPTFTSPLLSGPNAGSGIGGSVSPPRVDVAEAIESAVSQYFANNAWNFLGAVFLPAMPLIAAGQQIATIADRKASTTQKIIAGVGLGASLVPFLAEGAGMFAAAEETAPKLLSQFTTSTIEEVAASSDRLRKGGQISEGARAIAKKLGHAQAGGYTSAFDGIRATQSNASTLVRDILMNPARTFYGDTVIDVYNAAGQGVRLERASNTFIGFIEGTLATQ